jgi:hypothetical protein
MEPDLVSKEHDEAQELVSLPQTVKPIVHCALERCPGGEFNHSSTTPVSFFELFLATLSKAQCSTSDSRFDRVVRTES